MSTAAAIPSVRLTPAMSAMMRPHSAPMTAPSSVMPPYQMAEAIPIGTKVRTAPSPTRPRKRRHHRADAGKETTDEDAGGSEAEVFTLDDGQRARREQPAAGRRGEEAAAVSSRRSTPPRRPSRLAPR